MTTLHVEETRLQPQEEKKFIELKEAANELGIAINTLYTYIEALQLEKKKFIKDRSSYLLMEDFNKIKAVRQAAQEKKH